jgi:RepB DNA-primase from phage plasmid
MTAEDSSKPDSDQARRMLDLCASVGATAVDLTLTGSSGEKEWFRRNLPLSELGRMLPAMLDDATAKRRNIIIRPHGPEVTLLQLDDLKPHQLPAAAFVTLETSPGNYQAWLALPGKLDKEFASRVRKGAGADIGASGATRIPGSLNFKPEHAPAKTGRPHYPRVTITEARRGQITSAAELEQLGLVAAKEHFTALSPARFEADHLRQWPDYQYNLDRARPNKTGDGPDLSGVDFVWCMTAATWGFDVNDTAEKLLELSEHARHPSNGKDYAKRTAANAAHYVEQRRQQKQHRHG